MIRRKTPLANKKIMKITRQILGLFLAVISCTIYAEKVIHWGYSGNIGPEHWGDLDPKFSMCKMGQVQSPIDIPTKLVSKKDSTIKTFYTPSKAVIVNNGHTIQVNLKDGGDVHFGKSVYELLQFHMHTPSEEKIDGKGYPLNAHMVHVGLDEEEHHGETGKIAVIGLFFKEGKENSTLKPILDHMPHKKGMYVLPTKFDLTPLLPSDLSHYSYAGSLTTPGCSEDGVHFYILKTPVEMSRAQLSQFHNIFPMNARPVMPLNGREITESD